MIEPTKNHDPAVPLISDFYSLSAICFGFMAPAVLVHFNLFLRPKVAKMSYCRYEICFTVSSLYAKYPPTTTTHTHTNIHTLLFPLITNPDLYQQSPSVLLPGVVSYCLFSSCVLASQLQMTPVFPDNSDILPYILFVKAMSHQQCYISQSCCFIYKILMLSLQEKQG